MSVSRTPVVILGTDETTGVTIADTATTTSSEVDLLGSDIAMGQANFYLKKTGTGTTASGLRVRIFPARISGQTYDAQPPAANTLTYTPANGTEKIFLGTFIVPRYAVVEVRNTSGASMTNVFVAAEVFRMA